MSTFDDFSKTAARDLLTALGQPVTYRGDAGDVATVSVIDKAIDFFGSETNVGDARYTCSLLVEDVPEPQRGDRVTDENGVIWELGEDQSTSGNWISEWSVTRR